PVETQALVPPLDSTLARGLTAELPTFRTSTRISVNALKSQTPTCGRKASTAPVVAGKRRVAVDPTAPDNSVPGKRRPDESKAPPCGMVRMSAGAIGGCSFGGPPASIDSILNVSFSVALFVKTRTWTTFD